MNLLAEFQLQYILTMNNTINKMKINTHIMEVMKLKSNSKVSNKKVIHHLLVQINKVKAKKRKKRKKANEFQDKKN
jgi:hypothetical protein